MDRSLILSKDLHHNDPYTDYISWPGHSDRHFKYPISFSWNDWELSLPCPTSGPPLLPLLLLLSLLTDSFTQILPLGLCSSLPQRRHLLPWFYLSPPRGWLRHLLSLITTHVPFSSLTFSTACCIFPPGCSTNTSKCPKTISLYFSETWPPLSISLFLLILPEL